MQIIEDSVTFCSSHYWTYIFYSAATEPLALETQQSHNAGQEVIKMTKILIALRILAQHCQA